MFVVEAIEAQADNNLNGTWVLRADYDSPWVQYNIYTFYDGYFECLRDDVFVSRGTYTTDEDNGIITFSATHTFGRTWDILFEYLDASKLEPIWYSFDDFIIAINLAFLGFEDSNDFYDIVITRVIPSWYESYNLFYFVDSNELILFPGINDYYSTDDFIVTENERLFIKR
ncbi:MAG: hypothetical protein FWH12_07325 [Treponema sp.]|nr:hypothetical protein [Treponema sp.]